jgi:hypothetical protein
MAILIILEKVSESNESVVYRYDLSVSQFLDSSFGIIQFEKSGEGYKIIKEHANDENRKIANRALFAILREWKKGSFPDRTDWAS